MVGKIYGILLVLPTPITTAILVLILNGGSPRSPFSFLQPERTEQTFLQILFTSVLICLGRYPAGCICSSLAYKTQMQVGKLTGIACKCYKETIKPQTHGQEIPGGNMQQTI